MSSLSIFNRVPNPYRKNPTQVFPMRELYPDRLTGLNVFSMDTPLCSIIPHASVCTYSSNTDPWSRGFTFNPFTDVYADEYELPPSIWGYMGDSSVLPVLRGITNSSAHVANERTISFGSFDTTHGSYFHYNSLIDYTSCMRQALGYVVPSVDHAANSSSNLYSDANNYYSYATIGVRLFSNPTSVGKKVNAFSIPDNTLLLPQYALTPSGDTVKISGRRMKPRFSKMLILTDAESLTASESSYTFAILVVVSARADTNSSEAGEPSQTPLNGVTITKTTFTNGAAYTEIGNTGNWSYRVSGAYSNPEYGSSRTSHLSIFADLKLSNLNEFFTEVFARTFPCGYSANGTTLTTTQSDITDLSEPARDWFSRGYYATGAKISRACRETLAEIESVQNPSASDIKKRAKAWHFLRHVAEAEALDPQTVPMLAYPQNLLTKEWSKKAGLSMHTLKGFNYAPNKISSFTSDGISRVNSCLPTCINLGVDPDGKHSGRSTLSEVIKDGVRLQSAISGLGVEKGLAPSTLPMQDSAWGGLLRLASDTLARPTDGKADLYYPQDTAKYAGVLGNLTPRVGFGSFEETDFKELQDFSDLSGHYAGSSSIKGVTVANGVPMPKAVVYLYDRNTGALVRATLSDAMGRYAFYGLRGGLDYFAVGIDGTKTYNCVSEEFGVLGND